MSTYLAFTLGILWASAFQVLWALVRPTDRIRSRRRGKGHLPPYAKEAARTGEVVQVSVNYEPGGDHRVAIEYLLPATTPPLIVRGTDKAGTR